MKQRMEESSSDDACDTELCLSPGSGRRNRRPSSDPAAASSGRRGEEKEVGKIKAAHHHQRVEEEEEEEEEKDQQITMFYNGSICICDVTEIQARAIISMAANVHETAAACNGKERQPSMETAVRPQLLQRSLSMKRSLQMFLQKRKTRSHESSPYDHTNL